MELLPTKPELKFHVGAAYAWIGQYDKAIPLLNDSKAGFNDKNLWIVLGRSYKGLGKVDSAIFCWEKSITMYPKLLLPRLWLANMHYEHGEIELALNYLEEIIAIKPKAESIHSHAIKQDAIKLSSMIVDG